MQILGILLAALCYLVVLVVALAFNESDVAMAKQNREHPGTGEDLWMLSSIGFGLMIIAPLAPLAFMTDFLSWDRAFSWELWSVWLAFNLVTFVAARRYVFRPLMRDLDARRADK